MGTAIHVHGCEASAPVEGECDVNAAEAALAGLRHGRKYTLAAEAEQSGDFTVRDWQPDDGQLLQHSLLAQTRQHAFSVALCLP